MKDNKSSGGISFTGALTIIFFAPFGYILLTASTIDECFEPSGLNCFNQLGFLIDKTTSSSEIITGTACCFKIARDGKLEIFSNNFAHEVFKALDAAGFDIGTESVKTSSSVTCFFASSTGFSSTLDTTGLTSGFIGFITSVFLTGEGGVL